MIATYSTTFMTSDTFDLDSSLLDGLMLAGSLGMGHGCDLNSTWSAAGSKRGFPPSLSFVSRIKAMAAARRH